MFLHICVSASLRLPVFLFLFVTTCKRANKKRTPHLSFSCHCQRERRQNHKSFAGQSQRSSGCFQNSDAFAAAVEEPWKSVIPT